MKLGALPEWHAHNYGLIPKKLKGSWREGGHGTLGHRPSPPMSPWGPSPVSSHLNDMAMGWLSAFYLLAGSIYWPAKASSFLPSVPHAEYECCQHAVHRMLPRTLVPLWDLYHVSGQQTSITMIGCYSDPSNPLDGISKAVPPKAPSLSATTQSKHLETLDVSWMVGSHLLD